VHSETIAIHFYKSTIRLQTDAYAVICNLLLESKRKRERRREREREREREGRGRGRRRGKGRGRGRGRERGREKHRAYLITVLALGKECFSYKTIRSQKKFAITRGAKAKQATCQI
jgi:hypothetical protein